MMLEKTLPWHEPQWQRFFSLLKNHKLPHALLLTGNPGLGKQQFATQAAQILFCEHQNACGRCASCQLFISGNHPDYIVLAKTEDSQVIKIDTVRAMSAQVVQTGIQGGNKVIVIDSANDLQFAAANALLKLLEEPPANTYFILISANPHLLLPTIRSRCQIVQFMPSYSQATQQWLQQQGGNKLVLELAEGAPLLALQYAQDETLQNQYQTFEQSWLHFWQMRDGFAAAKTWHELDNPDLLTWVLKKCEMQMRDAPSSELGQFYEQVLQLKRTLHRQPNLNRQLQYEALLSR